MEDHDGLDDGRSMESYVVLDSSAPVAANDSSEYLDPKSDLRSSVFEGRTLTQSLRHATNSSQLTSILMEIWRPDDAPLDGNSAEETPSKRGRVLEVDIEEMLFALEEELKKLLSLIVYKRTLFVTKTAAMDVFSWICELDVVLDNPVVSKGDIVKWVLSLCAANDAITESAGLRGIRNLVHHEDYRRLLSHHDQFVQILDYIDGPSPVKHADVYVFEIFHTVMNADGSAPGQVIFMERLLKRMETDELSSEARLWGMQCIETCVRVMPDRDHLIETLVDDGDVLVWLTLGNEDVLSRSLDVTLTCLQYASYDKTLVLLNGITGRAAIMDRLLERLKCGLSHTETSVLKLFCKIAETLPNTFCDDCLDEAWIKLQIVLEQGSKENKEHVLDMLHHVAVAEGPMKKHTALPLPDSGLPFMRMLIEDLTPKTFDIVYFMWSHYQNVLPVLIELDFVSAVLSTLLTVCAWSDLNDFNKVRHFLVTVAGTANTPRECFGDCLVAFLDRVVEEEGEYLYIQDCVPLVLDLLVKLIQRSEQNLDWMVEQGLTALMERLIWSSYSPIPNTLKDDPAALFSVCRTLFCSQTEDEEEQRASSSLFVGAVNVAHTIGEEQVVQFLTDLKQQAAGKVFFSEESAVPEALCESGLGTDGLHVLRDLIHEWTMSDDQEFLISLLSVLLRCCLELNRVEDIESAGVLKSLADLLLVIKPIALEPPTAKIMMACMAEAERKAHGLLASFIDVAGSAAAKILWELVIDYQGNHLLSINDGKSVLALLKTVSGLHPSVDTVDQLARISEENAASREALHQKDKLISDLESKLLSLTRDLENCPARVEQKDDGQRTEGAQPDCHPTIVHLQAAVRRLQRLLHEKETVIAGVVDRNEQLMTEIHNREQCYSELVQVIDTQHDKLACLEDILEAEGYRVGI